MLHDPTDIDQTGAAVEAGGGVRPRVLIAAYACHPESSMESRLAWRRVALASDRHDVTVICGPAFSVETLSRLADEQGFGDRVTFHSLQHDRLGRVLLASRWLWYTGYSRWQHRALELAKRLHDKQPFDLVHQVNYAGYRVPGVLWRLGPPFIWGPFGGTQSFPVRFLRYAGPAGGARELSRNVLNYFQLRYSRRVGRAVKASDALIAATRQGQRDLFDARGVVTTRELETGLDCPISPLRPPRDPAQPLRVLNAGRLQPWKGLPLLIRAVAQLPAETQVQVRVLGEGPCERAWKGLAERLGVADRFEFIGWPTYHETLPHYAWADVFAFTSLRDTSGTGLLEALAHGTPILGLDHQGAADIMTDECAIRVPVKAPQEVIAGLREGMVGLSRDTQRWLELSRGAQARADRFCWGHRLEATNRRYAQALRTPSPIKANATQATPHGTLTQAYGEHASLSSSPLA